MSILDNSNKTFLTKIFSVFFGKNFSKLIVVTQNLALVFSAKSLYLIESKKVRSDFFAVFKGFTSSMSISFLNLDLGNNLLIFNFFF